MAKSENRVPNQAREKPSRRAVIDVGTNSVKLLVADVIGSEVHPIWEGSHQTRLGQSFYRTHRLQPLAILSTARAVAEFASKARALDAALIRILATSAARDALNATELVSAIRQASGLETEIISGEEEGDLAFRGVSTDPTLLQVPLLLLDVGGGSTEFILGQGGTHHFRQSFPIGTVRLLENLPHSDPPTQEEFVACRSWVTDFLQMKVRSDLAAALAREESPGRAIQLVGTGGTATVLASMEARLKTFDRSLIEAVRMGRDRLDWHVEFLWQVPLAERRQVTGLPPNRADVILAGSLIYQAVMTQFDFPELRISTRGLRFAALME